MTQLLDPPAPFGDEPDEAGVVARWIVEVDWWTSEPVSREYRLVLRDQVLCEIYRDRAGGSWYVERVYD